MRLAVLIGALCLASCSERPDEDAEKQFQLAMKSGTYGDVCAAAREATDQALAANDQAAFELWRLRRDVHCSTAARDPQGMPSRQQAEDEAAAERFNQMMEDEGLNIGGPADGGN